LTLQVSLDGAASAQHDAYRGHGTWGKTVAGIRALQSARFHVRLSTTETPANCDHLAELASFREQQLGIPASAHFIRPLARRGFSNEGVVVGKDTLQPELTVNADGVYWHPLSTDEDMLVCNDSTSLAKAVMAVRDELAALEEGEETCLEKFT
jgi:sulfatase maturation enzyme AslB (radical SAM superfamily)